MHSIRGVQAHLVYWLVVDSPPLRWSSVSSLVALKLLLSWDGVGMRKCAVCARKRFSPMNERTWTVGWNFPSNWALHTVRPSSRYQIRCFSSVTLAWRQHPLKEDLEQEFEGWKAYHISQQKTVFRTDTLKCNDLNYPRGQNNSLRGHSKIVKFEIKILNMSVSIYTCVSVFAGILNSSCVAEFCAVSPISDGKLKLSFEVRMAVVWCALQEV